MEAALTPTFKQNLSLDLIRQGGEISETNLYVRLKRSFQSSAAGHFLRVPRDSASFKLFC